MALTTHTAVGIVVFQLSTFGAAIFIARELGAAGQGRFQMLIATSALMMNFLGLGVDEAVSYQLPGYVAKADSYSLGVINYAFLFALASSTFVGGIVYLFAEPLATGVFGDPTLISEMRLIILLLPGMMLLNQAGGTLRGLGRSDLRSMVSNYLPGPFFLIAIAVLAADELSLSEVEILRTSTYIGAAAIAIVLIARVAPAPRASWPTGSAVRALHVFGGGMLPVRLASYVVQQPTIDLLIVGGIGDAKAVGIYFVAAKIGSIIAVVLTSFEIVMGPSLSQAAAIQDKALLSQRYSKSATAMAVLGAFLGSAVIVEREALLGVFGEEYVEGGLVLVAFSVAQIVTALAGPNTPLLLATGSIATEARLTATFAVGMIAAGLLMGYVVGPAGVAVASGGGFSGLAIIRYLICRKKFDFTGDGHNWSIGGRAMLAVCATEGASLFLPGDGPVLAFLLRGTLFVSLFLVLNRSAVEATYAIAQAFRKSDGG